MSLIKRIDKLLNDYKENKDKLHKVNPGSTDGVVAIFPSISYNNNLISMLTARSISILEQSKNPSYKNQIKRIQDKKKSDETKLEQLMGLVRAYQTELSETESVLIKKSRPDVIEVLTNISEKFNTFVRNLNSRYNGRQGIKINDEYDVQDLFNAILSLYFDDIRREETNPSLGGSSTRSDFFLPEENVCIEIKKSSNNTRNRQLKEQLNDDIQSYKKNSECKILFFFIYDPDYLISNPIGFENDYNDSTIFVRIFPKP